MENRKIIITLIAVTLSASLFLAIFLVTHPAPNGSGSARQRAAVLEKFDGADPESEKTSDVLKPVPLALSDSRVVSPVRGLRNNTVTYYEKGSGKLFDTNVETGKQTVVSDRMLPGFISSVWSPRRNEVIGTFTAPGGFEYRYYNLDTGSSAYLGTKIRSLVFSPTGSQIAYFEPGEPGGIWISQADGTISKNILETRLANLELYWLTEDLLAFSAQDGDSAYWNLYTLTLEGKLQKILDLQRGLLVKFSPDGGKILFSVIDEQGNLVLSVADRLDASLKVLPLETFASKCAWSLDAKRLVCGVPTYGAVADPALSGSISDELYELSLADDSLKTLWTTKTSGRLNVNVREIFISSLEDFVVLVNAFDEKLYSLPL